MVLTQIPKAFEVLGFFQVDSLTKWQSNLLRVKVIFH